METSLRVKYQSSKYSPKTPVRRYVRKSGDEYSWCEQLISDPRYDIRQGTVKGSDLPADIKEKCDSHTGAFYACEWPKK